MLLKDFIEIKGWVVKNVEEVGWVVGQIQYGLYMDDSWSWWFFQGFFIWDFWGRGLSWFL